MIDYDKKVFFDVETTGFADNYIISIGFIAYQGSKIVFQKDYFIDPEGVIEDSAFRVHGIPQSKVNNCSPFPAIWEKIGKYFENAVLVGHNVQYDVKCLVLALKRYGLEIPEFCSLCTCKNSKKFVKTLSHHKLDDMCNYFGIVLDNHHDAFADVVACRNIYNSLVDVSEGNLDVVYYDATGSPIQSTCKNGRK